MPVRCRGVLLVFLTTLLLIWGARGSISHASDSSGGSEPSASGFSFLNIYAGFKGNNFHLKLGSHYQVLHGIGTPEKLYHFFRHQWWSNLHWFLISKLLPPSAIPYPSFSNGLPSIARAFGDAPDCNPHPVIMDHPLLSHRLSVQTSCIDNQPVWQITASPITSVIEQETVNGKSLSVWLSLWKRLNDTNTSALFLRPWRDRQHNHLQAVICQAELFPDKACQSIFIDVPINNEQPWLLPELAKKEPVSPRGQTCLDSPYLTLVNQAIQCLSKKAHACPDNRWLYRLSDNEWLYKTGIPEPEVKPSPALITGHYFNLWSLEKASPENDTRPVWSRSSLFIANNDQHRKYHFWGAGDPVLIMQFSDVPYNTQDRYFGLDKPGIGTLMESQYLNLATLFLNALPNTPFNIYQWQGALSAFKSAPVPKSLGDRVREQIQRDPQSLYEFAKQRPELRNSIKSYLEREFRHHPVNTCFSDQTQPSSSADQTIERQQLPYTPNSQQTSPYLSSALLPAAINTASDTPDSSKVRLSETSSSSSSQKKKNNDNINRRNNPRKKQDDDEGDKKPPANRLSTLQNTPSTPAFWDHLLHLYREYHLEPETIEPMSDFVQNLLDIHSLEAFRVLYSQCMAVNQEKDAECLYPELCGRFNPENSSHMKLAAAALSSDLQVIVPLAYGAYQCRASNNQKSLKPEPLSSITAPSIIFLHDDKAVKLSYFTSGSRDFPWLPGFLSNSQLNKKETMWLESNRLKNALWQIFPEWRQHVLLCRESLDFDSIESASDALQQALTAPSEFMKSKYWKYLFKVYCHLGLTCYPFDATEGATGTEFYINKNSVGAVIFFWKNAAQRYAPILFPELHALAISPKIKSLTNYLTDFSTGALLIEEKLFVYVIPALLVLAPVIQKTHGTVNSVLKNRKALVYGGGSLRKHILKRIASDGLRKIPVTNDIDLAIESSESPEEFSAPLEQQLQSGLPGTLVRSVNLGLKRLQNQQGAVTTEKIIIYINPGRDFTKREDWRIFSIDISSATAKDHFDFNRVEPYQPDSALLIPTLPAIVERLLLDLQWFQGYTGDDKKRRVESVHKRLKILLSCDSDQQVQTIIRNALSQEAFTFGELPEYLQPFIKPLSNDDESLPEEEEHFPVAMAIHEINKADDKTESLPPPAPPQATQSQTSLAETTEVLPATESSKSVKKKKATTKKSTPAIIDLKTAEQQSEAITRWLENMDKRFLDALAQEAQKQPCKPTEESSALPTLPEKAKEANELAVRLQTGLTTTAEILTCSGTRVDISASHPVLTINLATDLNEKQREALKKAALDDHFPYAKLIQALLALNQKRSEKDPENTLQIYENAFDLLLPAALAGIPLAYQLLLGLQLDPQHPTGWPQIESVNRLLRNWAARESSTTQITIEGLLRGGFLEQLVQDSDAANLMLIEQGLGKESDLSARGKDVYTILKALREPDSQKAKALKEIRSASPELLQSIGLLRLLLGKHQEPAPKQLNTELWRYSINFLGLGTTLKKKTRHSHLLLNAPKVMAMSDLAALNGMATARALFKSHQGNAILFEHTGLWERYHRLSQSKDKNSIQDNFASLFNEISTNPVEKARPGLIRDWTLARAFLHSRARSQAATAAPESVKPTPEKNTHQQGVEKSAKKEERKREVKQQAEQDTQPDKGLSEQKKDSRKLKKKITGLEKKELQKGVKAIERAVQKARQKTNSPPLPLSADEDQQLSNLINHLDISLVQAIKSMQSPPLSYKQFEDLAKIYSDQVMESGNKTDAFQAGYYYFLTALSWLDARMSSDNKTIKLNISPSAYANSEKIIETIKNAKRYNFPYAPLLQFLFTYHLTGNHAGITMAGFVSALTGVSQGIELLMENPLASATLAGLALKWLVQLPNRFQLKLSFDIKSGSTADNSEYAGIDKDTAASLQLREFLEQLPAKGAVGALDPIIKRISKGFVDSPHLAGKSPEDAFHWSLKAEGNLRILLYLATGQKELLKTESLSENLKHSPEIKVFQYLMLESEADAPETKEFKELAQLLRSKTPPEGKLMTDITELALYLTGASASAPPLTYFHTMDFTDKDRVIASVFGSKPQLMKKAIQLLPELHGGNKITFQYLTVLVHLYLTQQAGGSTKKIMQLLRSLVTPGKDMKEFQTKLERKMWNKQPGNAGKTVHTTTAPYDNTPPELGIDSLKSFARGEDVYLIEAIKHAKYVGYEKLVALLSLYEGKFDPESLLMSGWLNCLAGLNLLKAEAQSERSVVLTVSRKAALSKAHVHFVKAREAGFPYAGYLDALILMRLNDCYQYSRGQVFEKRRTVIKELIIQQASTRKEGEPIFIEAGNILVDLLPAVMESALLNVRSAAEILIRIFTSEWVNLLQTPQAGWPAEVAKLLLTAPEIHDIHFSFSNEGTEIEEVLFSGKSHPDSFEAILLNPLDEVRQEPSLEKRLEAYDALLCWLIYDSDKPDSIKKYLRLIRAFMLKNPAVLDTKNVDSSAADRLLTDILMVGTSRIDYNEKVLSTLSEMPQLATYFDDYIYNLPFFKSEDDYPFRQNALLALHRARSTLIHYYLWAYEVMTKIPDNENDYFWKKVMPQIEIMKSSFVALLATGDLTAMHLDERVAMRNSFQAYKEDIDLWLGYFHTASWLNAWRLGQEEQQRIQRTTLEILKIDQGTRSHLLPIQHWHEHWSVHNNRNP